MELNKLTEEEKRVIIDKGTEAPFSNIYYKETAKGTYRCKQCGNLLFYSNAKFDSDMPGLAGWPSFDQAIPGSVEYQDDDTMSMHRTEVVCSKCKGHLGHLFPDSESNTGKHFCVNSCSLDLEKEK
ncbi:MAG: peptide-methionine (R)-S-oxide reductase MsrB [Candidatus Paceibacterota bacterium]|jgi:peptide-methionine (R)-S-oxide reductase